MMRTQDSAYLRGKAQAQSRVRLVCQPCPVPPATQSRRNLHCKQRNHHYAFLFKATRPSRYLPNEFRRYSPQSCVHGAAAGLSRLGRGLDRQADMLAVWFSAASVPETSPEPRVVPTSGLGVGVP